MVTTNVNVSDGLVNGARGEVVHTATNSDNTASHILVKVDFIIGIIDPSLLMNTILAIH